MPKENNRNIDKQVLTLVQNEQWKDLGHIWWGFSNKQNKFKDHARLQRAIKMFYATNFRIQLNPLALRLIAHSILTGIGGPKQDDNGEISHR